MIHEEEFAPVVLVWAFGPAGQGTRCFARCVQKTGLGLIPAPRESQLAPSLRRGLQLA